MPSPTIWPTHVCQLTKLAEEIASYDKISDILIIMPTKRLKTMFLATLAELRTAFYPPVIKNFDHFLFDLTADEELPLPLEEGGVEFLVHGLLKSENYKHLKPGHEHELVALIDQLIEFNQEKNATEKLRVQLEQDVYSSLANIDALMTRFNELEDFLNKFFDLVTKKGYTLPIIDMRTRAELVLQKTISFGNFKKIYFVGFTTLRVFYKPLLNKISELSNVSVWLTEAPDLLGDVNPLAELLSSNENKKNVTNKVLRHNNTLIVRKHRNPLYEVASTLQSVKELIERGESPKDICILVTSEKIYTRYLKLLLKSFPYPHNISLGEALSQSQLGSFLSVLKELLYSGDSKNTLLSFLLHPFVVQYLSKKFPHHEINREKITDTHNQGQNDLSLWLEDIREILSGFIRKKRRPLREHIQGFSEIYNQFVPKEDLTDENKTPEGQAREQCERFIMNVSASTLCYDPEMSGRDFWQLIHQKLVQSELRSIGYPLNGVQILRVIESRFIPFKAAFILGCHEGHFPKALPKDYLVEDRLKTKIGLFGWKYIEGLEDTTFHLLLERIPHLELNYSASIHDKSMVRSRFLEFVLSQKIAKLLPSCGETFLKGKNNAVSLPQNALEESLKQQGHFLGDRHKLLTELSSTSFNWLLSCPYRFLLKKINIREIGEKNAEDRIFEGRILHRILDAFFAGYQDDSFVLDALPEYIDSKNFLTFTEKRLRLLTEKMASTHIHSQFFQHLMLFSWPKVAKHFQISFEPSLHGFKRQPQIMTEYNFNQQVSIFNTSVQLTGAVDRIDIFSDFFVITDYKRKKPLQKKAVEMQLALYALALENTELKLDIEKTIIGYFCVIEGEWITIACGSLVPEHARSLFSVTSRTPAISYIIAELKNSWRFFYETLVNQNMDFAPVKSAECDICEYSGICRKDDPRFEKNLQTEDMELSHASC